jgi:DNA damage-binding protein 1
VGDTSAHEISAVSCTPPDPSKNFTHYIAASFWGSNCVKLFSPVANLDSICEKRSLPALPRSLLLHNFGQSTNTKDHDYHPHLLVGLTDGTVVSYALKSENEGFELVDQNIFSLGDLPVFLSACQVDSRKTVFACGSRASILFWERETLRHSPVFLKVCRILTQIRCFGVLI